MKHSELIAKTSSELGDELFSKVINIRKGRSSGNNYINLLFETEEDRDAARSKLGLTFHCNCMPRYGFGFLVLR